ISIGSLAFDSFSLTLSVGKGLASRICKNSTLIPSFSRSFIASSIGPLVDPQLTSVASACFLLDGKKLNFSISVISRAAVSSLVIRLSIMLILLNGSSSICPISSCSSPLVQQRGPEPRTALGDTPSGENANLWYGSLFPFVDPLFSALFPRLLLIESV